jgi:hypothetical protein
VEKARAWLMTKTDAQLSATDASGGYFETWVVGFDPLSYDWMADGNSVLVTDNEGTGNSVRYVIHRMCSVTGLVAVVGSKCVPVPSTNGVSSKNQSSGGAGVGVSTNTAYRITVRVAGPRNSLSFSQVMVH